MDFAIGVILLLTFFALAWYCIKGCNLMIGFLLITILWTVLPLGGTFFVSDEFLKANPVLLFGGDSGITLISILNKIFQSASESWGTTFVNICWGVWFGRALIDTGIASTLIRKTVELGGDKPVITISLLNLVTALIFTSMAGAGPVIAIAVIVLPILISLRIPKSVAMFTFMGSVAAGIYLNPVNFALFRAFFLDPSEMPGFNLGWYAVHFGYAASIIMLVITTLFAMFYLSRSKIHRQWAAQTRTPQDSGKTAPFYTVIIPFVPVFLNIAFNFSVIGGFIPENELVICVVFAALIFMGLFRGPMTLVGCGAATLGVLLNLGKFSVPFLYGVFAIPNITVNVGSCITQSCVAWGLAYTKVESRDFLKLSIPNAYAAGILQYSAVYLFLSGFGAG